MLLLESMAPLIVSCLRPEPTMMAAASIAGCNMCMSRQIIRRQARQARAGAVFERNVGLTAAV